MRDFKSSNQLYLQNKHNANAWHNATDKQLRTRLTKHTVFCFLKT